MAVTVMSVHPRAKSILVVEDNHEVAQLIQHVLASYGYHVQTADDQSVLQATREHLPDLILLDLVMPHLSGEEAARRLTQLPETSDIPIVLMSGADDVAQRAARVGAAGYLSKPFDLESLLNVIEHTLAKTDYANAKVGVSKVPE